MTTLIAILSLFFPGVFLFAPVAPFWFGLTIATLGGVLYFSSRPHRSPPSSVALVREAT